MNRKQLLTLMAVLLVLPALVWAQPNPANSIIIESKTVAPLAGPCNSAGLKVKVSITNLDSLAAIPLLLKTVSTSGGAYGTLGRSGACARTSVGHAFNFLFPPDATTDPPNLLQRLQSRIANYSGYNSSSRDDFLFALVSSNTSERFQMIPPNAVPTVLGEIKFDTVLAALGTFDIDTGNGSFLNPPIQDFTQFVDKNGNSIPVVFTKGVITVAVPPCLFTNCPGGAGLSVLYGRALTFDFNSDCEAAGAPHTYSITAGPAGSTIDANTGVFNFAGQCALGTLQLIVRVTNPFQTFSECTTSINVQDNAPSCTPANAVVTVSHGAIATNQINTADPDAGDNVTVTQTAGPGATAPGGAWSYQTGCADVGLSPQTVQEQVQDGFGNCQPGPLSATCQFNLVVTNAAPSITCPPNTQVQAGTPYSASASATDADPADVGNLVFSKVSGPAALTVSASGVVSWTPTPADAGPNAVTIQVTDLCGASAQCTYNVQVVVGAPFRICIDTIRAFQGTDVEVGINNIQDATDPDSGVANGKSVGGFSFLIGYDVSCLQFLSARKGALLVTQRWEFFTFRFGAVGNGNCGAGCPTGFIRVVAIADVNNGGAHPNLTRVNQGQWAVLKFRISNDRRLAGQCCQINWFWFDCTDNTVSDSTGNVLYVVDSLYNSSGIPVDLATAFPNNVANCDQFTGGPNKPSPKKRLIFCDGAICVPTPEEIDDRGDLNLNGLGYEIADAVLYENFFIFGPSVLQSDAQRRAAQVAASDVNGDGATLTVADLVALIRVITGDASPLPRINPAAGLVSIGLSSAGSNVTVSANSISDLGGLALKFKVKGAVGNLELAAAAADMTVKSNLDGEMLSVLLFSEGKNRIAPSAGAIFTLSVDGSIELVEAAAADYYGIDLPTLARGPVVPTEFGLAQNYPNPFNAKTSIRLALPVASDYTVTIYNVAGQVVKSFSGTAAAGTKTITWDGTDNHGVGVSSGIYFYKAVAGKFSATKKMLLLQ